MTLQEFKDLALSLPEVEETGEEARTDYSVKGVNFASLFAGSDPGGSSDDWAVVKLTPKVHAEMIEIAPQVFEACKGAWGRNGATVVLLRQANGGAVLRALMDAWGKVAPASLTQ